MVWKSNLKSLAHIRKLNFFLISCVILTFCQSEWLPQTGSVCSHFSDPIPIKSFSNTAFCLGNTQMHRWDCTFRLNNEGRQNGGNVHPKTHTEQREGERLTFECETPFEFQLGVCCLLADRLGGLVTCQMCTPPSPLVLINENAPVVHSLSGCSSEQLAVLTVCASL